MKVGYGWLVEQANIKAPMPEHTAEVRSVKRIETIGSFTAVPASVAPAGDSFLDHVLFALKHEGVNLTILAQVLPQITEEELRAAVDVSPTSQFLRKVGYLWEYFTGQTVQRAQANLRSNYVPLFNPKKYVTTTGTRNARWRVLFNGIGSPGYCVTVRRSPELTVLLDKDLLQRARDFTETLPADILNRALAWAYLDETRNTYAIENETPSGDKATRFVELLRQAHVSRELDEDYLVQLQNAVINNVYYHAASFRTEQNYLSSGSRGAVGVTYVPPEPQHARQLMGQLLNLANTPPTSIRRYWDVMYLDEEQFTFDFRGHPALYRYWDATRCVTFMIEAVEQAIEHHLKRETEYLARYDTIYQRIDRSWDIANADLAKLVMFCIDQHGKLSTKRRSRYEHMVPSDVFDALEEAYRETTEQNNGKEN